MARGKQSTRKANKVVDAHQCHKLLADAIAPEKKKNKNKKTKTKTPELNTIHNLLVGYQEGFDMKPLENSENIVTTMICDEITELTPYEYLMMEAMKDEEEEEGIDESNVEADNNLNGVVRDLMQMNK